MKSVLRNLCVAAVALLLSSGVAWAQATAELNGRVADESGAVLPGVTVTATQTDTGFVRTAVTDAAGTYSMPNLPTGPYKVEVSLQGFKTYVQTGIVLQVGGTPTINAVLGVGNLEETVSVEAAAPIVDVRSAGISEVVENERIVELPLQGRQVTDLIILAGGAVDMGRPNNRHFQGGTNISVAGGVIYGMSYSLDGAMHNDVQNAGGLPLPFPDALQEFSVATSGLGAQAGMQSGASVNAVTKSGTNRYSGVAFEFLRDKRFNAKSVFAAIGPDGKKKDDGLKRNQFGGTLGGPVVKDKLFFFGAYQGTPTRVVPNDNIAYVPTAAMLAGDFTAFASPACNNGRQVTLGGGIVNNRVDPARFSPAALKLTSLLPKTDNPCGETRFALPDDRDEYQAVGRVDYQLSTSQSVFGRYMATSDKKPSGYSASGGNPLTTVVPYSDNLAQSATFGNTVVVGTNLVNATRFAYNRTVVNRHNDPFFGPADLGIKAYSYTPPPAKELVLSVTGGFSIAGVTGTKGLALNNAYQVSDDLTLVRGSHQMAIGANVAYWNSVQQTYSRGGGSWTFDGSATGLGLADFLMGRVAALDHGASTGVTINQLYWGLYAQDAWRATDRVTINAGARWEPYLGQNIINGAVPNFSLDKFRQGVKSTVFTKAPAGFSYAGDPGFDGKRGFAAQWLNISPRVGLAWDVSGNGRTAVRSSYELGYSMPTGGLWFIMASAPPYGNRTRVTDPTGLFDNPYRDLGGDPHPIVVGPNTPYPPAGQLGAINPDIRAPRLQSWNVTLERQIGAAWGVSASYLGSYSDRLWNTRPLNPGVFLGLGPCAINGVNYPVCSTNANLNARRALSLEKPAEGQYISNLDEFVDTASQAYRGLKLSFRRRAASGVSLNGNYTVGRCFGLESNGSSASFGGSYVKPDDPDYDRGHCSTDRTHIANFTVGFETPAFSNLALRVLASSWKFSGIVSARSGSWLTVTTGRDTALTGQSGQRVKQISDDVYGAKTLNNYLNRAAFAEPAPGGYGNFVVNSIKGPAFWKADLALSRLFTFTTAQNVEIRLEAFNLFNRFNWGNPTTSFSSAAFGRIQSAAGDQRILQFGVKYTF